MKRTIRIFLAFAVLLATVGVFIWYTASHPTVIEELKKTPKITLLLLIGVYAIWFIPLVATIQISLRMYQKSIGAIENILLSAYSSLINFFGPGQSGPGLRALYLKRRKGLGVKQYVFATLIYYAWYSIISAVMLVGGVRPWWQTLLLVLATATVSYVALAYYAHKSHANKAANIARYSGWMLLATIGQCVLQAVLYTIELHAIGDKASIGQIVSYTGAADFSIFVAITPGAIGIREAFLVFTQRIHHIGNTAIVSANLLDRTAYVIFLGILAILVFSVHSRTSLRVRKVIDDEKEG